MLPSRISHRRLNKARPSARGRASVVRQHSRFDLASSPRAEVDVGFAHPYVHSASLDRATGTMDKAWTTPRAPCHARTPGGRRCRSAALPESVQFSVAIDTATGSTRPRAQSHMEHRPIQGRVLGLPGLSPGQVMRGEAPERTEHRPIHSRRPEPVPQQKHRPIHSGLEPGRWRKANWTVQSTGSPGAGPSRLKRAMFQSSGVWRDPGRNMQNTVYIYSFSE